MSARWRRRLQCAAACVSIAAYAGLSHYCNSVAGAHELGTALALGPLTFLALVCAWRWTPPPVALLLTAGLAGLLYGLWPLLEQNFPLFYLVQESSVYGLLGWTFSRSLMPNRTALCTQLADKVHGPLSAREVLYTRRVTIAWAIFFFAVSAASILLFLLAPLRIWSFYINFCVLPLVAAMFVAEYLVRRRVLPQVSRAGLLATVRVYFAPSRQS
ncbi:MAG TPA: hypothetical protein VNR70_00855 [Steroidobacteraceae bacterium]|nr:hypothetical protein [Steroidobacteraceae bacterium]